jgi:D-galactarolactone cycloisomerase
LKITEIKTYNLNASLETPFGWSQAWTDRRSIGIVKISTDEGITGWGEGCEGPSSTVVNKIISPLITGEDPLNRLGIWQKIFRSMYNGNTVVGYGGSALSAVDMALWDITGKALGVPVNMLIGGRIRDQVPVYATGLYYTKNEMDGGLALEAQSYAEQGFLGMKTKVGGLPIEKDVQRVKLIREVIGPDIKLMVDANQAYNTHTAIRVGNMLHNSDILWFEEPVNAQDLESYLQVKSNIPMSVAGGENLRTRFEFMEFLTKRAYDIVQPDVINVGGISEMRNVSMHANTMGIQVNPHVWGSPIMIAATLHVVCTVPPCPESFIAEPFEQEPVMEYDRTPSEIRDHLCHESFRMEKGHLKVPDGPGLGVTVNEKVLEKLTVSN